MPRTIAHFDATASLKVHSAVKKDEEKRLRDPTKKKQGKTNIGRRSVPLKDFATDPDATHEGYGKLLYQGKPFFPNDDIPYSDGPVDTAILSLVLNKRGEKESASMTNEDLAQWFATNNSVFGDAPRVIQLIEIHDRKQVMKVEKNSKRIATVEVELEKQKVWLDDHMKSTDGRFTTNETDIAKLKEDLLEETKIRQDMLEEENKKLKKKVEKEATKTNCRFNISNTKLSKVQKEQEVSTWRGNIARAQRNELREDLQAHIKKDEKATWRGNIARTQRNELDARLKKVEKARVYDLSR